MAMGDPGTLSNPYQYVNLLLADNTITGLATVDEGPLVYDPTTEVQLICSRNRPPSVDVAEPWPRVGWQWMDGFPYNPNTYVAPAVHFDGATRLSSTGNLVSPDDGNTFSISFWVKLPPNQTNTNYIYVVDPEDTFLSGHFVDTTAGAENASGTLDQGGVGDPHVTFEVSGYGTTGNWEHHLLSVELGTDQATSKYAYYINGELNVPTTNDPDPFPSLILFNGLPLFIGSDTTSSLTGDLADLWIAPGVSLLDEDGVIPEATQRLFTDASGRPQDPSGFPAGGVALFSGDASTFATNQGSGGAFTLTGALTNATTSPSD